MRRYMFSVLAALSLLLCASTVILWAHFTNNFLSDDLPISLWKVGESNVTGFQALSLQPAPSKFLGFRLGISYEPAPANSAGLWTHSHWEIRRYISIPFW